MQINHLDSFQFPVIDIVTDEVLIKTPQDVLDLLGEVGFSNLVLHDYNFEADFFDLSTKKLGDILQKFTNYHVKVAIIGDFEKYPSKVLKQFIYESNKVGDYLFVANMDEVKKRWAS
jgi:hypothetical protein